MNPGFNEKKATQVASAFLRLAGGTLNYMKLIKLMYLAEREALIAWGRPITYDSFFSLPHGPVLSATLDNITEQTQQGEESYWLKYISPPFGYEVKCIEECSTEKLSKAELSIIKSVYGKYGSYNQWKLVDLLHKILPEWKDPSGSSLPIQYRDILEAGGRSSESIKEIESEIEGIGELESLLALKN
jgi:uncharacterized phage-associated protein